MEAQEAIKLERRVFNQADRVEVTTEAMAATVQEQYGVAKDVIRVIPNYVETERFKPQSHALGERFRIGFVGRLDTQKNVGELLRAVTGLDAELILVGDGPQRAALEATAAAGKISAKFLGRVDNAELPSLLNSWDLFILPSLYEGHPKSLLEAMACGLAVIGTNVPGIAEIIVDGENGLLCETDAESIRAAIQRAMSDERLRVQMGQQARKNHGRPFFARSYR